MEMPVIKGSGNYRTIVGFRDIVLAFDYAYTLSNVGPFLCDDCSGCKMSGMDIIAAALPEKTECEPTLLDQCDHGHSGAINIEVKITPISISDILRQIALYREFCPGYWVLVTAFGIKPHELEALRRERVHHIRLGKDFEAFKAGSHGADEADSVVSL
jgi:hypothetical protein